MYMAFLASETNEKYVYAQIWQMQRERCMFVIGGIAMRIRVIRLQICPLRRVRTFGRIHAAEFLKTFVLQLTLESDTCTHMV